MTLFMTDTTDIRGYSLYQNSSVAKMMVPRDGDKVEAFGLSLEDEIKYGAIGYGSILTDMSTKIIYNDKEYKGWLYDIPKPANLDLVKDLKLLFANTTSSSLLSDWKVERVRTRVLFNLNKDLDFDYVTHETDSIVKIVPDNEKYYQEEGYKANGFSEKSGAKLVDDSGIPLVDDDLAVRQWPDKPEDFEKNGTTYAFMGWATEKVTFDEFKELEEKPNEEGYLTDVSQWKDVSIGTNVFIVNEDSPFDSHKVLYAVWGPKGR